MTPEGSAGLIGNLRKESGLQANNVENRMHDKLHMTDTEYTLAVDYGSYTVEQFISDEYGYGFPQWTHESRKILFYKFMKSKGLSIGDVGGQAEFIIKELKESYRGLWAILTSTHDIRHATVQVMIYYEGPYDQSEKERNKRYELAKETYERLNSDTPEPPNPEPDAKPYHYDNVKIPLLGLERKGNAVVALHGMLMVNGYAIKSDPMDYFGEETKNIVMEFQKAAGLKSDGMVGPKTYMAFFKV